VVDADHTPPGQPDSERDPPRAPARGRDPPRCGEIHQAMHGQPGQRRSSRTGVHDRGAGARPGPADTGAPRHVKRGRATRGGEAGTPTRSRERCRRDAGKQSVRHAEQQSARDGPSWRGPEDLWITGGLWRPSANRPTSERTPEPQAPGSGARAERAPETELRLRAEATLGG